MDDSWLYLCQFTASRFCYQGLISVPYISAMPLLLIDKSFFMTNFCSAFPKNLTTVSSIQYSKHQFPPTLISFPPTLDLACCRYTSSISPVRAPRHCFPRTRNRFSGRPASASTNRTPSRRLGLWGDAIVSQVTASETPRLDKRLDA